MNETKITASGFNFGGGYINMAGSGSYGALTVGVSGNTISLQALSGTAAISFNVSSTSVGNISNSGVATLVSGSTTGAWTVGGQLTVTGVLKIGAYVTAAQAQNGYILVTDSGGTVRRMLCG